MGPPVADNAGTAAAVAAPQARSDGGAPQALQALPLGGGGADDARAAAPSPWAARPAGLAWWRVGDGGPGPALLAVAGAAGGLAVVDVRSGSASEPGSAPADLLRPPLDPLGAGIRIAAAPAVVAPGRPPAAPGAPRACARIFVLRPGAGAAGGGWALEALEERASEEAVADLAAAGEWDAALRLAADARVSADAVHKCAALGAGAACGGAALGQAGRINCLQALGRARAGSPIM